MKSAAFFSVDNEEKLFQLNFIELSIIKKLEESNFYFAEKTEQFISKIKELKIDTIVKIAHHQEKFLACCKNPALDSYWTLLWSTYGQAMTVDKKNFFNYETDCAFDRLRGMYYFFRSQNVRKSLGDFHYSEIKFLQESVKYRCMQGIERYNQYLYKCIAESKSAEYINECYENIISHCQSIIINYGCYGYMMLCESYYQYSRWLAEIGNLEDAAQSYAAAITSCEFAQSTFKDHEYAIYNASLGRGLVTSNSYGIGAPEEAMLLLKAHCPPALVDYQNATVNCSP